MLLPIASADYNHVVLGPLLTYSPTERVFNLSQVFKARLRMLGPGKALYVPTDPQTHDLPENTLSINFCLQRMAETQTPKPYECWIMYTDPLRRTFLSLACVKIDPARFLAFCIYRACFFPRSLCGKV